MIRILFVPKSLICSVVRAVGLAEDGSLAEDGRGDRQVEARILALGGDGGTTGEENRRERGNARCC